MKKMYAKPIITFESLNASARFASGCALLGTTNAERMCPVIDEESGWVLFNDPMVCEFSPPDDNDQICYNIPAEGFNVFQS